MNLQNIIGEIEKTDPEVYDKLDTRRNVMKQFRTMGSRIAIAAVPFALGSMFSKAYGQPAGSVVLDVFNYALTLEYLEAEFYTKAVATAGLIPAGAATGAISTIRDHENSHVAFLRAAISGAGGTPVTKPTFDFTAGKGLGNGLFKDVFTNYVTFLAVAQTFEDTGVRAYKGRAGELVKGGALLTAALNIHSVEARHAAHIRQMRKSAGHNTTIKPWITGKDSGIGAVVQASYDGEDLTTQATINIININGTGISANAASEAFDEPLTKAQVLAIVGPFIV
ncbi:MAG: ferritin-like domain-containing protein [Chitinophagaceae bacterium]